MPQAMLSRREALGAIAAPLLAKDGPRPNFMFILIDDLRFSRGASSDCFPPRPSHTCSSGRPLRDDVQSDGHRLAHGIHEPYRTPVKIANSLQDRTGEPIQELLA